MSRHVVVVGALLVVGVVSSSMAAAQPPAGEVPPAPPAEEATPPQIIRLPNVELPADVEVPGDGVVTLELTVRADGRAEVASCDAPESICEPVRAAIAEGEFEPARRNGEPVGARIAMRFRVQQAPREETSADDTLPGRPVESDEGERAADSRAVTLEQSYGATARVERAPAGVLRLELEEMRELPGAFGDPFRAIEALPGVTPIFSGLPYFFIRGAPPSGTLYVYDDINLPALFHFALGPSVVHPRMVGPLRLYSGVPPARFGRFIGGVIEAEGPDPAEEGVHGEVEARLFDVSGFVQTPVGDGEIAIAGRYGWPGLVVSVLAEDVDLQYWDYQLRFAYPVGSGDHVEVVSLGSFDLFGFVDEETDAMGRTTMEESELILQFHRLETRLVRRRENFELGSALQLGWEESSIGSTENTVSLDAFTFGPRIWARVDMDDVTLRVGGDIIGSAGGITLDFEDDMESPDPENAQDPGRNDAYAAVAGRSKAAVYGEVFWDPYETLTLDLGLRADAWAVGSALEAAIDPRLRATYHVSETFDVHIAGGIARQPAVFFIPLPGLTEVAVDRGLQTAAQAETGIALEPIEDLSIETQLFAHRYWNLLFNDLFLDGEVCQEPMAGCENVTPDPRVEGASFGGELFVRVHPRHRISGFLSYTLAWAQLDALPGIDYTPSYDVRHVLNVATRFRLSDHWSIGLRAHVRSGKPIGVWFLALDELELQRYEQRLPVFYRLDGQIAYSWETSWGRFRLSLEWLNFTLSEEPTGIDCPQPLFARPTQQCPVDRSPPITLPSIGLRASF